MPDRSLEEILSILPTINSTRRYWFFRTNGGEYYGSFLKRNYIAINYNKVSVHDIASAKVDNAISIEILSAIVTKVYKDREKRPNYAASQLLKFAYELKKGDIVLIPSTSSFEVSFGEITDRAIYVSEPEGEDNCPYTKRRAVRWLKHIKRDALDPNLYKLMFSHHAITEGAYYGEYIDRVTNSFYIKDNKAYVILQVQSADEIKAKDLFGFGSNTLDLVEEFCAEEGITVDTNGFNVKLDLQSPGFILFSAADMSGIVMVGLMIVAICGGGFSFKIPHKGIKTGLKTDGLIEKLIKFIDTTNKGKIKKDLLENQAKDMKIKDPDDLRKIFKDLDK
jgi:restriction system protein